MINKLAMQWGYLLAAFVFGLTGCAYDPATQGGATSENSFFYRSATRGVQKDGVQQKLRVDNALGESLPDYTIMNPVPIVFDKFSVKLDESDKYIVQEISERAKNANQLVITGYCDRHQIGNAKAAAIARATAVRNELMYWGVPAKKIKIKHVTEVAGKHAVDIEF